MSSETRAKLEEFWRRYAYLVADEFSMLAKIFFAKLSTRVAIGKNALDRGSFGGVSVMLAGDLHQFPPVGTSPANRLYHPRHATDSALMVEGRNIYEEFKDVVILREQMRVIDDDWRVFLSKVRRGYVQETDLRILDDLILGRPGSRPIPANDAKWRQPFLVTPRHAVRNEWNNAALRAHCADTGQRLYICSAEDRTDTGRELTLAERIALLQSTSNTRRSSTKQLPKEVQLAVGAVVLVTQNIDTDLDITNGARGKVVAIALHPDEPLHDDASITRLSRMPLYVLVKLDRTR
ncbi:hypothetical protein GGF50DRAFT_38744, partial [Schizophyllum commune]